MSRWNAQVLRSQGHYPGDVRIERKPMSNPYAPTKTVNVPDDVLEVLRQMQWTTQNGTETHGVIVEQLDRALYTKTNKILELLGGKWNRKAKAHVFQIDPRPSIGLVVEDGQLEVVRDGYFPTPLEVGITMAQMADLEPGIDVLEPSAGTGDLVRAILDVEPTCQVSVIEIDDKRRSYLLENGYDVVGTDFLTYNEKHWRIIQNPPFENLQDIDHVLHAHDCLKPGGILVSVMSESPFFRNDHKAIDFRTWYASHSSQSIALDASAFNGIRTRLVRIDKDDNMPSGQLRLL